MEELAFILNDLNILKFEFLIRGKIRMVLMAPKRTRSGTNAKKNLAILLNLSIVKHF
jgi:hypothetical protein